MMISIVPSSISGQQNADVTQTKFQRMFTLTFSKNDFSFSTQNGYDKVQLDEGRFTTEIGKPMVPVKNIKIALPADMKVTGIYINELKEERVDGAFLLYPVQLTLRSSQTENENQFVQPDAKTYLSNQIYPAQYIEVTGQNDLAGQSIAEVTIYPIHYVPLQKKLTTVTSITFTIEGTNGYICGDYLSGHVSDSGFKLYQQMVQNMVLNPEDVVLHSSLNPQPAGVDPSDYDYVIVTQDSWVSAFQPLADWKTKKGIPANIVTTTWIYNEGNYSGTNVDKIKAFVQDVYTNWGTTFILLGGDVDVVPCNFKTFSSVDPGSVPNDAYYADFDADWVCEVNVGRASVTGPGSGTGQIGNFITKILNYETNPPLTNFAMNAGFFGFDLDSRTHGQQCKININTSYIPAGWTTTTVYDSQSGNHITNVINAMNAGQNLLNHADHSSSDFMGTGYVNHNWGIGNSDMDALVNGNKQGILYSMGCDPAAYDVSNCIAEHFVQNSNGGGIAFIGNSRYGWFQSGSVNSLSMLFDTYFFRSIFQGNLYNLGAAFSDHKNDGYQNDNYYKYIYTELTLLGDPELPIWTENPIALDAAFSTQISIGTSDFTVTVTSGGNPVNQASVCLWKGDEIYQTGYTDSAGQITFSISPSTRGSMFVTITKHNYLPFQGSTLVIGGNNNPPHIPPKPDGTVTGQFNTEYTYSTRTTDPENDQIYYKWSWGNIEGDWMGPYASGATISTTHTWPAGGIYQVKVKAKDIFDSESDWSPSLFVTIIGPKANLTIGTFTGGLLKVSTGIKNIGEMPATKIQWSLNITGGFILSGKTISGSIATLDVNTSESLLDSPILGFGKVTITVKVTADGIPEMEKTAQGFVLLFYVIT